MSRPGCVPRVQCKTVVPCVAFTFTDVCGVPFSAPVSGYNAQLYSFNTCLLGCNHVPSDVLFADDTTGSKTDGNPCPGAYLLVEETDTSEIKE